MARGKTTLVWLESAMMVGFAPFFDGWVSFWQFH
jgi:hypothetical protein